MNENYETENQSKPSIQTKQDAQRVQELTGIIQEIERLKPRLSMGTYEVMIEQPEEEKNDKPEFTNR